MDGSNKPAGEGKLLQVKQVGEYSKLGVGVDHADQSFALEASF
jgi:hypothetical protein